MAGYAQYDAGAANAAEPGGGRAPPGVDPGMLPPPREGKFEIHVQVNHGMWWAMPRELSEQLLEVWRGGENQGSYVWDWGGARLGSYVDPEGEATSLNRYVIDFAAMRQRNSDNNRTRAIRIVQVLASGADTD